MNKKTQLYYIEFIKMKYTLYQIFHKIFNVFYAIDFTNQNVNFQLISIAPDQII